MKFEKFLTEWVLFCLIIPIFCIQVSFLIKMPDYIDITMSFWFRVIIQLSCIIGFVLGIFRTFKKLKTN
jgi:hypothetical protein